MRAVIQRVKNADVKIDGKVIGEINHGLLVLLAIHQNDPSSPQSDSGQAGSGQVEEIIEKMAEKIINLRIFGDSEKKMNLSVKDVNGEALVVSQFTLYGDCKKGNRPSFIESAEPKKALFFYNQFVEYLKNSGIKTETGKFGAMMEVELTNDGPVTIIVDL